MTTASESAGRQIQNRNLVNKIPQTYMSLMPFILVVNPTTVSDFKYALQQKHHKQLC